MQFAKKYGFFAFSGVQIEMLNLTARSHLVKRSGERGLLVLSRASEILCSGLVSQCVQGLRIVICDDKFMQLTGKLKGVRSSYPRLTAFRFAL